MEICIQGDDHSAPVAGIIDDLTIGSAIEADVGNVLNVDACLLQVMNRAAGQTLIQQEPDHAAPKVVI
jgi:hypothetical protein